MKKASWIWENAEIHADEYAKFYDRFSYNDAPVTLEISCDTNYECYINGKLAAFGQYSDYPYDKVFDRIDITLVLPIQHRALLPHRAAGLYLQNVIGLVLLIGMAQ